MAGMLYRVDGGGECLDRALAVAAVEEDGPDRVMNQPRMGMYLRIFFAVTVVYLGKSRPIKSTSISFWWLARMILEVGGAAASVM